jgi:hypothetical protein
LPRILLPPCAFERESERPAFLSTALWRHDGQALPIPATNPICQSGKPATTSRCRPWQLHAGFPPIVMQTLSSLLPWLYHLAEMPCKQGQTAGATAKVGIN